MGESKKAKLAKRVKISTLFAFFALPAFLFPQTFNTWFRKVSPVCLYTHRGQFGSEKSPLSVYILIADNSAPSSNLVTKITEREPVARALRPVEDLVEDVSGVRFPMRLEVGRNQGVGVIDARGDRRVLS